MMQTKVAKYPNKEICDFVFIRKKPVYDNKNEIVGLEYPCQCKLCVEIKLPYDKTLVQQDPSKGYGGLVAHLKG